MKFFAAAILVFALSSGVAGAGEFESLTEEAGWNFEEAKKSAIDDPDLARKQFKRAGEVFALASENAGDPGAAHYNAGNAYLFAGEVGDAVFHYRMAQVYHPFDPNVAHNLDSARMQVLDSVVVKPSRSVSDFFAVVVRWTPAWIRVFLFVAGYVGLFIVLGLALIKGPSGWHRNVSVACGSVALVGGLTLVAEWWVCQGGRDGVVAVEEVVVRTGDGAVYPWAFTQPLHSGVEVRILEKRGEWMRVLLWSGDEGWLRADGIRVVEAGS